MVTHISVITIAKNVNNTSSAIRWSIYNETVVFYSDMNELEVVNDAIQASDMAWWFMELPSGAIFFHPNKLRMLGYTDRDSDQFIHYSSFTKILHPDDYEPTMQAMRDHIAGKVNRYKSTYRIKAKDGTYRRFADRGRVVARDEKGNFAVSGIVIDISDDDFLSIR